jgi:hypothetical protein
MTLDTIFIQIKALQTRTPAAKILPTLAALTGGPKDFNGSQTV